jgi:hypothetical protein
LTDFLGKLKSGVEREEVLAAYHQRRRNLANAFDREDYDPGEKPPKPLTIPTEEIFNVVANREGIGFSYHTYEDIGKFTIFPETHWKRMFPGTTFGKNELETYSKNKTRGIQHREEAMRITNELSKLTLPHQRHIDYAKIARTFTNK